MVEDRIRNDRIRELEEELAWLTLKRDHPRTLYEEKRAIDVRIPTLKTEYRELTGLEYDFKEKD